MDFDDNNVSEVPDEESVEIYSKKAIFWFSVLASPLFGGVLLMLNLKAAGLMKAFYTVLVFILLFMFLTDIALSRFLLTHKINVYVPDRNLLMFYGITLAFNIVCAIVFTQYFFKKHFPDDDYYPKSITTPVIITILTIVFLRIIGLGI